MPAGCSRGGEDGLRGRWLHGEPEVCVQIWEEDGAWRRWVVRDEEEGDGRWMEEMGRRGEMETLREMDRRGFWGRPER
ncbi:hypothetical protein MRB53_008060 [Persea americana]|uniref:Uncharacterized protein n=1 Tax=Persea americana TaxID=3435 RepID=A0ACC2MKQ5_PERAE|nr:hypothetical protein MRB53_008060 [Persea americana]